MKSKESSKANNIDTLIISDTHLGSEVSRAEKAFAVLKKYKFRQLILLGDIFDDLNFNHLEKSHWELLSYIHEIADPKKKIKIVWVIGNHDILLQNFSNFIGVEIVKKYIWKFKGEKYLAIHGHQFDSFLHKNPIISAIASFLYLVIQKLDSRKQTISRFIKRTSKGWLRLSAQVAKRAIFYARWNRAKYIFCGHTHKAMSETSGNINYWNSGCFTDVPSNYITISEDGVKIHTC
ncbi:MAG: metallophosphoesterase family protein [Patescibacteria group bacterium]